MSHERGARFAPHASASAAGAYQGAPTIVTAFMSTGVKAGAFAAFVRVFFRKSINQRMVQFDVAGFYALRASVASTSPE